MKKTFFFSFFLTALALGATAQVKIKDGSVTGTSSVPNKTAILDLESNNKGLHVPRVLLQATNSPVPLNGETTSFSTMDSGLVVYNLATAGTAPYNVTPGLYYCDGTQWVRAAGKGDWLIFGNANSAVNGTPAGSSDSQYVTGRVAIGTNTAPRIYNTTAGGDSAHKFAYLTTNGDASINSMTVGIGGGQVAGNTATGYQALFNNQSGASNAALGYQVLGSNTTGGNNAALGYQALVLNTTGGNNAALGFSASINNTTGTQNVAIGSQALSKNQTGGGAVAVGYAALGNSTGAYADHTVAVGYAALMGNAGVGNTAVGSYSLQSNGTGQANTAVGYSALNQNSTGTLNTSVGFNALQSNTTGYQNVAIGANALQNNVSGYYNLAIGEQALQSNTASENVAVGNFAMNQNTTGTDNTSVGTNAARYNTKGSYNTGIGGYALQTNTTGNNNTALGYYALLMDSLNNDNTAIGYQALVNSRANSNTAVGSNAARNATTGAGNTVIGYKAASNLSTGSNNIVIGDSAAPLYVGTGNNNIVIGAGQDIGTGSTSTSYYLNIGGGILGMNMSGNVTSPAGNIGISAVPNASYALNVGGNTNVNGNITATGTITPSDRRIKTNVESFTDGLNVITKLKPVTFRYNEKSGLDQQTKHVGFIAQDVEKVAPYMVTTIDDSKGASGLSDKRELDMGALNQILVNAVQEQQKEIEQQHEENKRQQAEIDALKKQVEQLLKK